MMVILLNSVFSLGFSLAFEVVLTMDKLDDGIWSFVLCDEGHSAVEYAVMVALIVIACIATLTTIGTKAFQSTVTRL